MHEGFSKPQPNICPPPPRPDIAPHVMQRSAVESVADNRSTFSGEDATVRPPSEPVPDDLRTAPAGRGHRNCEPPSAAVKAEPAAKAAGLTDRARQPDANQAAVDDVPAAAAEPPTPEVPEPKQEHKPNPVSAHTSPPKKTSSRDDASAPSTTARDTPTARATLPALAAGASRDEPDRHEQPDKPAPEPPEHVQPPADETAPDADEVIEFAAVVRDPPAVKILEHSPDGQIRVTDADPERYAATLWNMQQIREVASQAIPQRERFVNPGMEAFFEAKGLQPSPVYVLTREEINKLSQKLLKVGYANDYLDELGAPAGTLDGLHVPELGVSLVANTEMLTGNPVLLQYLVAHEIAHATNGHHDLVVEVTPEGINIYCYEQVGQVNQIDQTGHFLEEAFCVDVATEYVREGLHLPNGLWGDDASPRNTHVRGIYLPPIYVWPTSQGAKVDKPAFAAFALALLKQASPPLAGSLVRARSSLQGLHEVADAINDVRPGLYSQLIQLPPTDEAFQDGLLLVQDTLGVTAHNYRP